MIRSRTLSLLIALGALLCPSMAAAELAPTPVENGDFYFSAGIALYTYKTQNLQVGRRYVDDDWVGTGITTTYDRGFLLSFDTDEQHVITPEINFGWAFEEPLFRGALGSKTRLHFSAYGNRRQGSGFIPFAQPPTQAFWLVNPTTGQPELRDTYIYMAPINGQERLANGNDATWMLSTPFTNNSMQFRSYFGSGDMMIYFDEPESMWQFSRGAGLTVGYENSSWAWGMNSPALGALIPALAPASWTYAFKLHTLYIGPRAAFSIGFEPARALSVFFAGSFAPMFAFTATSGTQIGQCLAACNINGINSTGSVGVARPERDRHQLRLRRARRGRREHLPAADPPDGDGRRVREQPVRDPAGGQGGQALRDRPRRPVGILRPRDGHHQLLAPRLLALGVRTTTPRARRARARRRVAGFFARAASAARCRRSRCRPPRSRPRCRASSG